MSRHAESDPDCLDVLAADMPPIPEDRIDGWDEKPWLTEHLEPEEVDRGHP